jgi:hypothetical protein
VHTYRFDLAVVGNTFGFVRQQCGQCRKGRLGLTERFHLLPVPEQHDGDQRRKLPPELKVEPVETRRQ